MDLFHMSLYTLSWMWAVEIAQSINKAHKTSPKQNVWKPTLQPNTSVMESSLHFSETFLGKWTGKGKNKEQLNPPTLISFFTQQSKPHAAM